MCGTSGNGDLHYLDFTLGYTSNSVASWSYGQVVDAFNTASTDWPNRIAGYYLDKAQLLTPTNDFTYYYDVGTYFGSALKFLINPEACILTNLQIAT